MRLENAFVEALTHKDLGADPNNPKVPPAQLKIQPAPSCNSCCCPFPATPNEHLEDSSPSRGKGQLRCAGNHTWISFGITPGPRDCLLGSHTRRRAGPAHGVQGAAQRAGWEMGDLGTGLMYLGEIWDIFGWNMGSV